VSKQNNFSLSSADALALTGYFVQSTSYPDKAVSLGHGIQEWRPNWASDFS
jgi:hypothetical protein